jgi:hypothetical protein
LLANDSIKQLLFGKAVKLNKFSTKFEDDNLLLNIDGVVRAKCKKLLLATRSRKKSWLSKRNGIASFGGWRNWRKYTIKYTCCKSKFAISKQKEM